MSIENLFSILKDGKWHALDELASQVGIQNSRLTELSALLSEHGITKYEDSTRRIRIEPDWRFSLPEEEPTEPRTTVATFILPPKTGVNVESTRINNMSNVELEISIRLNRKIEEVAVDF